MRYHSTARSQVSEAANIVRAQFPFPGYMDQAASCITIATTILKYVRPADTVRILDFGSGPCDKTAVISALGYSCSAFDDLQDGWHDLPGRREAIIQFTKRMGIEFNLAHNGIPWKDETFDVIMLCSVIEHLHNSPRVLLNKLLQLLKSEGYLLITVPSAVNIRKRIDVLFGRTNLPRFDSYYWSPDPWRGHIREYTKGDLRSLAKNLGVSIVELRSCDHFPQVVPPGLRLLYRGITGVFPGWKDSWLLLAQKHKGWKPTADKPPGALKLYGGYH